MAAMPSSARAGEVPCPDPSVHDHQHKLSEQASTAALYVTDPAKRNETRQNPLGPDGKLSSQSAAASLKYARPQDLPSYPSHGLNTADSAGKAAMLAKDYKMKELWQPELSSAGSKAALLAHKDGGKLDLWQPSASKDGNSAAVLAMRNKGLSPELDRGYTQDGKHRALLAATLSVHRGNTASPTPSAPAAYPDSHNAGFNALNAATRANTTKSAPDGWDSEANQAARVKNLSAHVNPSVFQENPHLDIDPDDTKHQAALRASAVSMAKQMYEYQNRTTLGPDLTGKEGAAAAAAAQQPATGERDYKQEAMRYIHLQDAAHKLAQERLAKVDKSFEAAKYREYYGYPDQQPSRRKSLNRLSMRSGGGRGRRRAASESNSAGLDDDSDDDETQARRIRSQMSQLNSGLSSVDEKKRSDDRARLLAAAEKSVHDRMHKMDEKVFADTGKVPPAMMDEWEAKARERAQKEREMQAQHPGKTHIGGGKFIDQSEIEAIAAARLKPTLDEINETAEKKRARDEELRLEREEQERVKREEKAKKAEEKDEQRRMKNEEKAAKKAEKEEARARKSEEKRKSREVKREDDAAAVTATGEGNEEADESGKRKSTLGRIASRLRRKDKKAEEQETATEERGEPEKKTEEGKDVTSTTAAAGAGAAAGAVAASTTISDNKDDDDEVDPVAKREAEEQEELDRMNSGDHTDATRDSTTPARPELEKHFSHIGHSDDDLSEDERDDETDDEDEWNESQEKAGTEEELAEKGKERFSHDDVAAPSGASTEGSHVLDPEHSGQTSTASPSGAPHQTYTANQLDPNIRDKGPAPHTIGPHESDVANVIDPRVKPDLDNQTTSTPTTSTGQDLATEPGSDDTTGPASKTIGPHSSNLANIADPSVKPDPEKQDHRSKGDETGPAAHTFGPHKSDLANVVDPRVKPEPEAMKAGEKHKEGKVAGDPQPTEKEKSGIRGFFNKFRHRESKDEREPGKISKSRYGAEEAKREESTSAAAAVGTAGEKKSTETTSSTIPSHAGQAGTDGPIGADLRASTSTSSFQRHAASPKNPSDVSSSGLEEEDLDRGRAATGSISKPGPATAGKEGGFGSKLGLEREEDEDGELEQFEEARDTFDESLAPPPAFGGQAKSESPHRETRFREEV